MGSYYDEKDSLRVCIFLLLTFIIFAYCFIVMRNTYRIIWKGLWKLYCIWCAQLVYLILVLVISILRPIWASEVFDKIWENDTFCSVLGRLWSFSILATNVFVTLFSYYKGKTMRFVLLTSSIERYCISSLFGRNHKQITYSTPLSVISCLRFVFLSHLRLLSFPQSMITVFKDYFVRNCWKWFFK